MWLYLVILVLVLLFSMIRILREYERAVVFRLGRLIGVKGPGLIILIPFIDKMVKVSLRTVVLDVPPQDVITKDNVSVKVNAVVYFRVMDAAKAVVEVENYAYATSQIAQTTLRSVLGEVELDELLAQREELNHRLQRIIDTQTDPWGVKVSAVEIKHVDLPQEMQRAMAKQAEAERERRAKIISAEGEYQAAEKLKEAAEVLAQNPITIQLRYLQTLTEISTENASTIVFPVPIEFFKLFTPEKKEK
jgi:regulator of protease activity HflC (stomatin/prohibitin superfamily)|uniref:Slipin family protein n=1 Tax=candidate division WOR-3 bacterium TaxID=2052148 RepID=A0A7V3KPT2_UNCW3